MSLGIRGVIAAAIVAVATSSLYAALMNPATLDTTFNGTGFVQTDINGGNDNGGVLVVQPDRKIVVGGNVGFGAEHDYVVLRYNENGSLDPTWGVGGKFIYNFSFNDGVQAIARQPDGKIITGSGGNGGGFDMLRLNPNGTLDTSFGGTGHVQVNAPGINMISGARAIVVQPDGKIVVGGTTRLGNLADAWDFAVARLNPNGALDTTFGVAGFNVQSITSASDQISAIALQNDGKIVAVGHSATDIAAMRYLPNGALDPTFGNGASGIFTTDLGLDNDQCNGLVIRPDGTILLGANSQNSSGLLTGAATLVRLTPGGTLDPTFGVGGKVVNHFTQFDDVRSLTALQDDHYLMVLDSGLSMICFNSDGTLFSSFGAGGKALSPTNAVGGASALAPDGKIVLGGIAVGNQFDFFTARFVGLPEPSTGAVSMVIIGVAALTRRTRRRWA